MDLLVSIYRVVSEAFEFTSNAAGTFLSGCALWALVFRRKEIGIVLSILTSVKLHGRINRIKETLGKLESLNYDSKDSRREIVALIGQLTGQVRPLLESFPQLNQVLESMNEFVGSARKRTEAQKRSISSELHGILDQAFHDGAVKSVIPRNE